MIQDGRNPCKPAISMAAGVLRCFTARAGGCAGSLLRRSRDQRLGCRGHSGAVEKYSRVFSVRMGNRGRIQISRADLQDVRGSPFPDRIKRKPIGYAKNLLPVEDAGFPRPHIHDILPICDGSPRKPGRARMSSSQLQFKEAHHQGRYVNVSANGFRYTKDRGPWRPQAVG